ncbi:tryptophanyl-tRNA synthetase [Catovirus CTV1]|uniref:tryptophan--tRNA ligase n=1 Tax=Catovirus CTV1 TaxID=1977631 RepID=A0A1V0S998_9VIRU|nr:tryptophanyl-tRNA synthetase [Catovirus CTV1]
MQSEQIVTPWTVSSNGSIDYDKLIDKFGCKPIDGKLIRRFEEVTGKKAHTWLRRGLFFSHKDLEVILNVYEAGKPVYVYTGRGPTSEALHMGHMIPFMFTKYIQDALDAIVVIQMSDTEKFYFKENLELEEANRLSYENAKDIIACGFNPDKTFIFSDLDNMGNSIYKNVVLVMKNMSGSQIKSTYGLNYQNNVGEFSWPCFQIAPVFSNSFENIFGKDTIPCLVIMAIDQCPYIRNSRDVADKLKHRGYLKPSEIHTKFLVSLEGTNAKMSSTGNNTAIFMTDDCKTIDKKIKKCFSGGGDTKILQQTNGANLKIDIAYQWLLYFLDDDDELKDIAIKYKSGQMLTGEIKKRLSEIVQNLIKKHQINRNAITDQILKHYFDGNKKFDLTVNRKNENIGEYNENIYSKYGFNFDPYFGLYKKDENNIS